MGTSWPRLGVLAASLGLTVALVGCASHREAHIRGAVEALRNTDTEPHQKSVVVLRLIEMGEPAIPALIDALSDERAPVRRGAAFAPAGIGRASHAAVPALVRAPVAA